MKQIRLAVKNVAETDFFPPQNQLIGGCSITGYYRIQVLLTVGQLIGLPLVCVRLLVHVFV